MSNAPSPQSPDQDTPPSQHLSLSMVVVFYLGMLFCALVWAAFTELGLALLWREPSLSPGLPWWMAGIGTGLALVIATRIAEPLWPAMATLSAELKIALGPRSFGEIAVLAMSSGVVEEVFFRGAVQYSLGYVLASLLFAFAHGGPTKRYYAWATFALVAGLSFGLLAAAYASIWPAVVAHVVVNGVNLRRLTRIQPTEMR